jgi:hypothetical protein
MVRSFGSTGLGRANPKKYYKIIVFFNANKVAR